jgi:hypothetical protein
VPAVDAALDGDPGQASASAVAVGAPGTLSAEPVPDMVSATATLGGGVALLMGLAAAAAAKRRRMQIEVAGGLDQSGGGAVDCAV